MEHLKDMGIRYRDLAERKFAEYDYVGAKKLCQKAKDFFAGLSLLSTFITVIDIYLSREKIVDDEPDWCLHKFSCYKERMNQDIFSTGCGEFFKFISRISESPKETASSSLNEDDKRSSNHESVKGLANKIRRSSRTIVRPSKMVISSLFTIAILVKLCLLAEFDESQMAIRKGKINNTHVLQCPEVLSASLRDAN
ncbi:DnaJ heat shock amino-terminal domain protein [Artemisia annua]|uniref:DnaJ heat shock amino-terminal domain protein n=1 Tax=Artemisia annua TaxID=35608 RepID=A0A2U1L526_ARTAN|nr:DnaJ heat shock amino-terminal domain protein [Artemisia annua]